MSKIKIGLFGFGVVGQGIYEVVRKAKNANAEIVKICVRDPKKPRKIEVDPSLFTTSVDEILDNQNVNLVVEVIDNGPKITQEEVDRFMMPLVTSKAGGLGLGLSICSNIAERHHGHISGYANPDGGVTIAMDIPRAALPEHTAM